MVLIYYTTENNDLNLHPSEFKFNDLNNAEEAKEVLAKVIKNVADYRVYDLNGNNRSHLGTLDEMVDDFNNEELDNGGWWLLALNLTADEVSEVQKKVWAEMVESFTPNITKSKQAQHGQLCTVLRFLFYPFDLNTSILTH